MQAGRLCRLYEDKNTTNDIKEKLTRILTKLLERNYIFC